MKKLLLALFLTTSFSAFSAIKVGIVNIQKIMGEISEGKSVNSTLQKSYEAKKKLIAKEEKKIVELQEKFKKQDAVLSAQAKAKKSNEIAQMMSAVRKKVQGFQTDIRKQEAELRKPILEKLRPIIDDVSKKAKVELTFELSTSPVVFAANKVDLSDKIIKAYDKKYAKKSSKK